MWASSQLPRSRKQLSTVEVLLHRPNLLSPKTAPDPGCSSCSPPEVSIAEVSMPVVSWLIGLPGEGSLVHRDLGFAALPLQNNANYVEAARRRPVAGDATDLSASHR